MADYTDEYGNQNGDEQNNMDSPLSPDSTDNNPDSVNTPQTCGEQSENAESNDIREEQEETEKTVYRWNYDIQNEYDRNLARKEHKNGVRTYAFIMTAAFLLSFIILIFVLLTGSTYRSYSVDESESIDILEDAMDSVVTLYVETLGKTSTGSGIIMTSDGYIATNYHVIEDAERIIVRFYDTKQLHASVVGYSKTDDLALIKVEAEGLSSAKIGSSKECRTGQRIYAIGAPAGIDFGWSVTEGTISCADRWFKEYDSSDTMIKKMHVIQIDAQVNPGNSGGPLINAAGEVLGIVYLKLTDQYEGMGFALPIDDVMTILNEIKLNGNANGITSPITFSRPVLGITGTGVEKGKYYLPDENGLTPVDSEYASAHSDTVFSCNKTGVLVISVNDGTGATDKLKRGDIITNVNGYEVTSVRQVSTVLNDMFPGDTVNITFVRDGKMFEVKIKLGTA